MNITSAHIKRLNGEDLYIEAVIEGIVHMIPFDTSNRDYIEIMQQIEAGTLVLDSPVTVEA